ncbi:MAG TPA: ABC transporter ATP-binding protein [Acetobacteraceae bacterium]|nr:ABC transporter ATP-binding protein [Acetobacteraceae bacterium]
MTAPLLSVQDLMVRIGPLRPISCIGFDVAAGEMLGIAGESGSGKSLTLRAILGLLPSSASVEGRVLWAGQDLLQLSPRALAGVRGREIGMVFQEPMMALNPVLPIGLQITESLRAHLGLRGAAARTRAAELLDRVGIPAARERLGSFPHEFSGGMRQRAMIAIALAAEPKLLLADEPTTALDVTIQDQILKLLLRLRDELAMSVVLVTHDLGVIAETCDRVVIVYAGRVQESGPVAEIFARPAHAYTEGLLRSLPDPRRARQRLVPIAGSPPDPTELPAGCPFAPRCPAAIPACLAAVPPLVPAGPRRVSACLRAGELTARALAPA